MSLWPRIVLASTSRYRRALLDQIHLVHEAAAPLYEEEHELALPPEALVVHLAVRKAESLSARYPDALLVGADQVAVLDGEILLKPGSVAGAESQLRRLSGRHHRLLAAVAVHCTRSGRTVHGLDQHDMHMRPLREDEIQRYVALDDPVDCAGSYKVECAGAGLFRAMEGRDPTGIQGLPLTLLISLVQSLYPDWTPFSAHGDEAQ